MNILEVDVPQDIASFQKRVVGPFTGRQATVFGIAAAIDLVLIGIFGVSSFENLWPVYLFLDGLVCMFIVEPFPGIKMEKYLSMFLRYNVLTPRVRTLQMQDTHAEASIKPVGLKKKEIAGHPEYKIYR